MGNKLERYAESYGTKVRHQHQATFKIFLCQYYNNYKMFLSVFVIVIDSLTIIS
jgi:hypothetical protein